VLPLSKLQSHLTQFVLRAASYQAFYAQPCKKVHVRVYVHGSLRRVARVRGDGQLCEKVQN